MVLLNREEKNKIRIVLLLYVRIHLPSIPLTQKLVNTGSAEVSVKLINASNLFLLLLRKYNFVFFHYKKKMHPIEKIQISCN